MADAAEMVRLEAALIDTQNRVEQLLKELLPHPEGIEEQLLQAMSYAVTAGGKRLRPFLVRASGQLFDVPRDQALMAGAALECIHTYSLVHDDLPCMDDDDLRRGKPTVHRKWDDATAVLTGDALLTLAFDILANEKCHHDPRVRINLVATLAREAGHHGMAGGQMIDMLAESGDVVLDMGGVTRLQQMKTGALMRCAVELGAILGHATEQQTYALVSYAHDLGLAFQIKDDLLDVEGTEGELGKAVGKDGGKATFVSLMGVARARTQADMLAEQAVQHLDMFDDRAGLLRALPQFVITRRH